MKSFCQSYKGKNLFEEYFETIEIENMPINEKEATKRICAVIRALLEIDQILDSRESSKMNEEVA
jgi:hypothetical protein